MDTKTKLQNALKDAMRAGYTLSKDTLSLAIAAIQMS